MDAETSSAWRLFGGEGAALRHKTLREAAFNKTPSPKRPAAFMAR